MNDPYDKSGIKQMTAIVGAERDESLASVVTAIRLNQAKDG